MKLLLYPKGLLEAAWCKDKKHYADGDTADPPKCLRCGAPLAPHLMVNALSRYVAVQICEACGMDEALRDAVHIPLSLEEWDAIKQGRLLRPQKSRDCYLKTTCGFDQVFQHTYTPPCRPPSDLSARWLTPAPIMTGAGGGRPGMMSVRKNRLRNWQKKSTSSKVPCSSCQPSRRWKPCGGSAAMHSLPTRQRNSTFIPRPIICISGFV